MKKVLVTGANGVVGSAVCRELDSRGIRVSAVVRDEDSAVGRIGDIDGIDIIYMDLSAIHKLHEIVSDRDFDVFYHFAWTGSAGPLRGDYSVQLKNIEYTCNAVKAARKLGCSRFVFAASIMEYEVRKLMETDKKAGINTLYSTAKLAAEYMARAEADHEGIVYVGGVISNIYGPGETSPRLVNTTIRKLQNGDYCTFSPGEQLYDFIYVDDAARAFYELGENALPGRSYYVGSGEIRQLRYYLETIRDVVAPGTEIGLGAIPFDGVSLTYKELDTDALRKDTGFVPAVGFEEGIRRTDLWIREVRKNG